MYYEYTQEQLRAYSRTSIESFEIWARRLIHEQMTNKYGNDYINKTCEDGTPLVKNDIRKHVYKLKSKNPDRFKRDVDTLFTEHIIYFLCNPKWYNDLFKPALDYAFPQGDMEIREFLNRIIPVRNALSHSNSISIRQAEQAICYSHDFIDGLKQYYKDRGEEQVWNVPRIIRIKDSFGNVFENPNDKDISQSIFNVSDAIFCGDTYSLEIEIDSSFNKEDYTIRWMFNQNDTTESNDETKFTIEFKPSDVAKKTYIFCILTSKKEWHKYGQYDNKIAIGITVLPPIV